MHLQPRTTVHTFTRSSSHCRYSQPATPGCDLSSLRCPGSPARIGLCSETLCAQRAQTQQQRMAMPSSAVSLPHSPGEGGGSEDWQLPLKRMSGRTPARLTLHTGEKKDKHYWYQKRTQDSATCKYLIQRLTTKGGKINTRRSKINKYCEINDDFWSHE